MPSDKPLLPPDLAATIARVGIDPTLDDRALQDAIKAAIAERRGYLTWDVDEKGWRVDLHSPEQQDFHGRTLELALAWCLVWLLHDELWIGAFEA
jgi:hypothetical protein